MNAIEKYQSPKELRRSLLPVMEKRLTDGELTIYRATLEKSISEYESVQLTKEVREALKWIVRDIGYRYASAEDEQYIVIRFTSILTKYYGGLSLKDVKQAFEMLAVGGLDTLIKPEDRKHYGQLSMDYLCRVLNAYKVQRNEVIGKAYNNIPAQEVDNSEEATRLERVNRERLIEAVLYYKYHNKVKPTNAIQEMIFCRILEGVGLLGCVAEPDTDVLINQAIRGFGGKYRKPLEQAFRYITEKELQIKDIIKV